MRCRRPCIPTSVIAVAAVSLLAAGCGGGASPGVASVASSTNATTTATAQNGLVAFARCMRSNGVTNFPDPDSSGDIPKPQVIAARKSNPSRFDAAQTACRHLRPDGGKPPSQAELAQRLRGLLAFARCMRKHGFPNFPDPNSQGDFSFSGTGINQSSAAVLAVGKTCLPTADGAVRLPSHAG